MVTMQDAIRVARGIVLADINARRMLDYERHPDFEEMRRVAEEARQFLKDAGH